MYRHGNDKKDCNYMATYWYIVGKEVTRKRPLRANETQKSYYDVIQICTFSLINCTKIYKI